MQLCLYILEKCLSRITEAGQQLGEVTRHMATPATLLGCQGTDAFRWELPRALDAGVSPVMVKEILCQAVDYLGIGRVLPFLDIANEVLTARGVALPLEGQATTMTDRLEKGIQTRVAMSGPQMLEAWKAGHIGRWLAANRFGDYYTRTGLALALDPALFGYAAGHHKRGSHDMTASLFHVISAVSRSYRDLT